MNKLTAMLRHGRMDVFLSDGELRGLRTATLFYYEKETRMIVKYFNEQQLGLLKPYELTKNHIENNISLYMKSVKKLSVATINIRLRAFKTVIKWLNENKKIPTNPMKSIKKLKDRKKEIVALNSQQITRFFKAIDKKTWIGVRDYAICLVLIETGVRQNELLNIDVTDILWEENSILIRHSKTYRMRKVPFTENTKKALKRWILIRGEAKTSQLFCNISLLRLTGRGLHQIVSKYARKANIENTRVSPHVFRHSFARL